MKRILPHIAARIPTLLFGVALAWLIAEIGVRVLFGSMPNTLQIALRDVHRTPFSGERLAPPPLWVADTRYQTIVQPGAVESLQAGSPTILFRVSSFAWWGGRVGFRSPQPTDGTTQIIALGDSHTFCFTAFNDCWTERLAALTGKRVDNLGQPVTGSVAHLRIYQDFVAKFKDTVKQPSLVIWQFYGNDFNDDYGLAQLDGTSVTPAPTITTADSPPDQSWLAQNSAVYVLIRALIRPPAANVALFIDPYTQTRGRVTIQFGQSYLTDSFDLTAPRNLEGEALSYAAIREARDLVTANGGKLLLITIPTKEEVYSDLTLPDLGAAGLARLRAPVDHVLQFCTQAQITCLDLLPALQAATKQYPDVMLYYSADPHLTPAGNEIVAAAIKAVS